MLGDVPPAQAREGGDMASSKVGRSRVRSRHGSHGINMKRDLTPPPQGDSEEYNDTDNLKEKYKLEDMEIKTTLGKIVLLLY